MAAPIVVTGASGFIGSALVRWLEYKGLPVVGLARTRPCEPKIEQIEDYADFNPPDGAVLVHLAQGRDVAAAGDESMVGLCRTLLAKNWAHVVFASSAVVYGDSESHPRRLDEPVMPGSPYGEIKLKCEREVLAHGGCVLRVSNIYGPGMAANNVISDILGQIPGTGNLTLWDDTPVRDFLWIDDAVACFGVAATTGQGGVFNLGTGRGTSIRQLAQCSLDIAGESERAIVCTRPADRQSTLILDIEMTTSTLHWTPSVTVREGMQTLLKAA